MTMTYGSVCSGIEAATVAWQGLGWKPSWFSEIEPFPSAVLAHHYPDVPNTGDMLALPRKILAGEVHAPDILCGGTPCQGFSVAGLRGSLDDDRSNLSLTFCEIANAIDQIRHLRGEQPSIIFWENVPGVLNTKDNAFGCLLGELAGETCELQPPGGASKWANAGCVFGPQRTVAWRVFDAQYFGVAQRRRRVFVVASARTWFDPAEILFEFDGLRRDTAPSRKARQEVATTTGSGIEGGSRPALSQNGFRMTAFGEYADDETASTMKARDYKDATDLVSYGIPGNWIGRKPENGGNSTQFMHEVAPAQTATDKHGVVAFNSRQDPVSDNYASFACADTGPTMGASGPAYSRTGNERVEAEALAITFPLNSMTMLGRPSDDLKPRMGLGVGGPDDPQNTLTGNHHHAVAIAWDEELNARQELAGTLLRGGQGGRHDGVMVPAHGMQVRRLTPVECERLQGFQDNYTQIPWAGKPADQCPDGHRYKALGNSWAVPVVRWIGSRIDAAVNLHTSGNNSKLSPTYVEGL